MLSDQLNQAITLKDGRTLGYAQVGDPNGKPVFHFHGWPGSRLDVNIFRLAGDLAAAGMRLIALDRPGLGLSDFQPGRRILDWPDDVVQLADALGIERFSVQGWSGGGPYVAACLYKIHKRVISAGFIACLGPPDIGEHKIMSGLRYIYPLARHAPWLLPTWTWLLWGRAGRDQAKMEAALAQIQDMIAPKDRQFYAKPEPRRAVAASMAAGFHPGTRGMAYDAVLWGRPWGFSLQEISHSRVFVWHGEEDTNVPPSFGRVIGRAMTNSQTIFFPDDGHLSIILDHGMEIISSLVAEI